MNRIAPDPRLKTVAELVRQNAYFADIGTDHAYLPVFLMESGRIRAAYASDINEGPLRTAKAHIAEKGLSDRIALCRADGLSGLFDNFPDVTDIAVCGMGGELIARILSEEPRVKDPKIRLLLQPMSRQNLLREYLASEGFSVLTERLTEAQGRVYSCIVAEYTGQPYSLTPFEAEVGSEIIASAPRDALFSRYLCEKIDVWQEKIRGLQIGNRDTSAEEEMLRNLELLERGNENDG